MLRLLIICVPLMLLPRATAMDTRPAISSAQVSDSAMAKRAAVLVQSRFALSAAAIDCRFAENLYGYHLLLAQLSGEQRRLVRSSEREGRMKGAAQPIDGSAPACAATLSALHDADDALVVLAERAGNAETADR